MSDEQSILELEKSIKSNKNAIKTKKKRIPFTISGLVLAYFLIFNLSSNVLSDYIDNQIEFIQLISIVFVILLLLYVIVTIYSISRLNTINKEQNISLYKVAKLKEEVS